MQRQEDLCEFQTSFKTQTNNVKTETQQSRSVCASVQLPAGLDCSCLVLPLSPLHPMSATKAPPGVWGGSHLCTHTQAANTSLCYHFCFVFCFCLRVSLCSPGCPGLAL